MKFLCAVEAMNLDSLFGDCEDLSATRGGGLSVLGLGREVAKALRIPDDDVFTASASKGLFLLEGDGRDAVGSRVGDAVSGHRFYRFATMFWAVREYDEGRFQAIREELTSDLRWQQMQSASVVYPALDGSGGVCAVDRVRPSVLQDAKGRVSEFTYERRQLGRDAKSGLLKQILDKAADEFQVVEDLNELAEDEGRQRGNLADKIAVLRFDGNSFGAKAASFEDPRQLRAFSKSVRASQERFFQELLLDGQGSIRPEWFNGDKLRMEVVVYGGDEVQFIVPAWLGWHALDTFYSTVQAADVSYAGAIVFCHAKSPIHSVKRLASDLVDKAKGLGNRSNEVLYQTLESFDAVGRDLDRFWEERWGFAKGRGVCLKPEEIKRFGKEMEDLRNSVGKRQLHTLADRLIKSKEAVDVEGELKKLAEGRDSAPDNAKGILRELHGELGDAVFVHLLELWDYAGVPA